MPTGARFRPFDTTTHGPLVGSGGTGQAQIEANRRDSHSCQNSGDPWKLALFLPVQIVPAQSSQGFRWSPEIGVLRKYTVGRSPWTAADAGAPIGPGHFRRPRMLDQGVRRGTRKWVPRRPPHHGNWVRSAIFIRVGERAAAHRCFVFFSPNRGRDVACQSQLIPGNWLCFLPSCQPSAVSGQFEERLRGREFRLKTGH